MRCRVLLWAAVLQLVLSTSLSAQLVLRGRAQEVSTGVALRCMRVELLNTDGVVVDTTETARHGDFTVTAPAAGRYRLRISAWDFLEALTEPLEFPRTREARVAFRIPVVIDAVALDSSTKANEGREIQMDRRSRGPEYPVDMLAEGRDGRVILMYSILPDGRVDRRSAFPLVSSHESFLGAVFRALPTFRYPKSVVPTGRPCYLVAQPFVFKLYH